MPESWLDCHQTKCLHPPPPLSLFSLMSVMSPVQLPLSLLASLSLSLPLPVKQESRHLRFLRQDHRSFCPGLRTDGIPSPPCSCCCCCPAVAPGIQNRSLTSAWLLEYANFPRIKGTQRMDTYTLAPANSFVHTETKIHSNAEMQKCRNAVHKGQTTS